MIVGSIPIRNGSSTRDDGRLDGEYTVAASRSNNRELWRLRRWVKVDKVVGKLELL